MRGGVVPSEGPGKKQRRSFSGLGPSLTKTLRAMNTYATLYEALQDAVDLLDQRMGDGTATEAEEDLYIWLCGDVGDGGLGLTPTSEMDQE